MAPTPTPTATITPTPGPNVFQKLWNKVNPKESPVPSGTVTPDASESMTPVAAVVASATPSPVVHKAVSKKKGTAHKHHKRHKAVKKSHKAKPETQSTPSAMEEVTPTPTPNA
jgi:hypothetical protein